MSDEFAASTSGALQLANSSISLSTTPSASARTAGPQVGALWSKRSGEGVLENTTRRKSHGRGQLVRVNLASTPRKKTRRMEGVATASERTQLSIAHIRDDVGSRLSVDQNLWSLCLTDHTNAFRSPRWRNTMF